MRDRNKGGGVTIYMRNNFQAKIILYAPPNDDFQRTDSEIVFSVMYRAPNCLAGESRKFYEPFTSSIVIESVIIVGDFGIGIGICEFSQ